MQAELDDWRRVEVIDLKHRFRAATTFIVLVIVSIPIVVFAAVQFY